MRQMSPQWQTREVADVLQWLRQFNEDRSDKVQFFGVEYYLTGQRVYDAVEDYVARTAPDRLEEFASTWKRFAADLRPLRLHRAPTRRSTTRGPTSTTPAPCYGSSTPSPHRGRPAHAIAFHHAHQIVSFYEHYSLPFTDNLVYRDGVPRSTSLVARPDPRPGRLLGGQPHTANGARPAHRPCRRGRIFGSPAPGRTSAGGTATIPVDRLRLRPWQRALGPGDTVTLLATGARMVRATPG